ncbi:MAG: trypsin-like peptidase domain-containing protein [Okeania sp. SIO3C4]|nr:trypsin-like peptidase domain-containing protein [Okeania sp. SIO3B3]NER04992.1 trypsin-like peptidase domain-containing protein [Okeania sp. SIO3C4]
MTSIISEFVTSGSGVIIGKEGSTYYVLSAAHIFRNQNDYQVAVRSKEAAGGVEIVQLEIIRLYPNEDLAVVKFASIKQYQVAEVGEVSQLKNNTQVYVAGLPGRENREGFQFTPAQVTK